MLKVLALFLILSYEFQNFQVYGSTNKGGKQTEKSSKKVGSTKVTPQKTSAKPSLEKKPLTKKASDDSGKVDTVKKAPEKPLTKKALDDTGKVDPVKKASEKPLTRKVSDGGNKLANTSDKLLTTLLRGPKDAATKQLSIPLASQTNRNTKDQTVDLRQISDYKILELMYLKVFKKQFEETKFFETKRLDMCGGTEDAKNELAKRVKHIEQKLEGQNLQLLDNNDANNIFASPSALKSDDRENISKDSPKCKNVTLVLKLLNEKTSIAFEQEIILMSNPISATQHEGKTNSQRGNNGPSWLMVIPFNYDNVEGYFFVTSSKVKGSFEGQIQGYLSPEGILYRAQSSIPDVPKFVLKNERPKNPQQEIALLKRLFIMQISLQPMLKSIALDKVTEFLKST